MMSNFLSSFIFFMLENFRAKAKWVNREVIVILNIVIDHKCHSVLLSKCVVFVVDALNQGDYLLSYFSLMIQVGPSNLASLYPRSTNHRNKRR